MPTATTDPGDATTAPDPGPDPRPVPTAPRGSTAPSNPGATAADCDEIAVEVPTRYAQDAAQCMPTAAAMAASAVGRPLTPREVARTMRMHLDGAHFFDLEEALRDLGLGAVTTVASLDHVAVAIERGVVPILAVRRGAERHVVVLTRMSMCATDDEVTATWVDPIDGRDHTGTASALQARRSADQVLLVAARGVDPLADWPLDGAADLRATHARFRAETLYRRALAHEDHGDQAMRLVLRASAEDPCWMPPRDWMYAHRPDDVAALAACDGY